MPYADLIPQHLEDAKTIKLGELANWLGVTTKTIHEWIKASRLPRPTQVGPRTYLFRVKELRDAFKAMDQQPEKPKRRK